ncbi:MAG: cytochrome c oxidase subunit II, partial [Gemmatimonadaceae bacterium]|nr:cytochrome c oxidase subunit II [Gemmatimonadaceae bacterium]
GNTTLEILWTAIPAVILAVIAVPTVRTIVTTQAAAKADALQVQVIGHQWWWEFKYPQYGVTTANELYLPIGRTVNFSLKTIDVLHSFWIPQLGGKRDLISNHENFLWFTPDSAGVGAWNGFCGEYCGTSHTNMRFRTFTVTAADFESWAKHQASSAVFAAPTTAAPTPGAVVGSATSAPAAAPATLASVSVPPASATTDAPSTAVGSTGYVFPQDKIPAHAVPGTPIPAGLAYNESLRGDADRGRQLLTAGQGGCLGCHMIKGNPSMLGVVGPNLTHVASRATIAAGLFPNDTRHLARWIKNARAMKPGVTMPTLGRGEYDPVMKATLPQGLTDEQIADIVAYLQALK